MRRGTPLDRAAATREEGWTSVAAAGIEPVVEPEPGSYTDNPDVQAAAAAVEPDVPVLPSVAKGAPAVKAKAKAEPKTRSRARYYTVTRVVEGCEHLLGFHYCAYALLRDQLPGQNLIGSGCHLAGFDTVEAAAAYWVAEGWSAPAPYFDSA